MSLAVLGQRGPRMTMVNAATGERLVANAHPPSFAWNRAVSWPRHEVPGRTSVALQYGFTGNGQVAALELSFDRRLPEDAGGTADLVSVVDFLDRLLVPAAPMKAPPSVVLVWPNLLTFEAVVTSLGVEYRDLAVNGEPLLLVATLALEGVPATTRVQGGTS